jgi:hypothetical protein
LNKAAGYDIIFLMTTSELELKTRRFTAKLNDRELKKTIALIEEVLDERTFDRSVAGRLPSRPWTEIRAELDKKFGLGD